MTCVPREADASVLQLKGSEPEPFFDVCKATTRGECVLAGQCLKVAHQLTSFGDLSLGDLRLLLSFLPEDGTQTAKTAKLDRDSRK